MVRGREGWRFGGFVVVLVRLGLDTKLHYNWTLKIGCMPIPGGLTGGLVGVADGVGMNLVKDCLGWTGQGKIWLCWRRREDGKCLSLIVALERW